MTLVLTGHYRDHRGTIEISEIDPHIHKHLTDDKVGLSITEKKNRLVNKSC